MADGCAPEKMEQTKALDEITDAENFIDHKIVELELKKFRAKLDMEIRDIIREELLGLNGLKSRSNKECCETLRSEVLFLREEIKNKTKINDRVESHNLNLILKDRITFLEREITEKNKLISLFASNAIMHDEQKNVSHKSTNHINKNNIPTDKFYFPKRPSRNNHLNDQNKIKLYNRFELLSTDDDDAINTNDNEQNEQMNRIDDKLTHKNIDKKHITTRKRNERKKNDKQQQQQHQQPKIVSILGDSIVKELKGYELTDNDTRVIVKSFPGAKTECMKDYIKPTLKQNPDVIILHCGTNNLKHHDNDDEVADNIINLALESSMTSNVLVSGLTARDDRFKNRIPKINDIVKRKCADRNIGFIDNSNIIAEHLNRSRLHLNRKGNNILSKNIELSVKN